MYLLVHFAIINVLTGMRIVIPQIIEIYYCVVV